MFFKKKSLKIHFKAVHEKAKPYQCETCKKCFARKDYLKYHIGFVCEKQKVKPPDHKCEVCEKYDNYVCVKNTPTNQRQNSLITRKQNTVKQVQDPLHTPNEGCKNFAEHDEAKPHKCETCRKCFVCKYALNFHIQIVHQSLPSKLSKPHDHKCDACEKYENYIRVRNKSDWHQHNLIVSEQNVTEQVQDPLAVTDLDSKTIDSKSLDMNHALQSGSCNVDVTQEICSSSHFVKMEPCDIPDENSTEETFASGIIKQDDLEIKKEPSDKSDIKVSKYQ